MLKLEEQKKEGLINQHEKGSMETIWQPQGKSHETGKI